MNQHSTTMKGEKDREMIADQTFLDAYFHRIGYSGERTTTITALKEILLLHPQAIPFENLNPFLRIPVFLDIAALFQKLVHGGRGGYCFEHNLLLKHVLTELGFQVKCLAARVLWNQPEGTITARGHMLLLIDFEDQLFIADAGFGGNTLTAPLILESGLEQLTPHGTYRLLNDHPYFILQFELNGEWKSMYQFTLEEQFLPDYEVTNWYLSNHPNSHFVTGLIAARVESNKRYNLRNNQLSIHHTNGLTEKKDIASSSILIDILTNVFLINLPHDIDPDGAFQKLFAN